MVFPGPTFRGYLVRLAPVTRTANSRTGLGPDPDRQGAYRGNLVGLTAVAVARGAVKAINVVSQVAATEVVVTGTMITKTAMTRPSTQYEPAR